MFARPDLDSFRQGAMYRHVPSRETAEFLGVASMPELDDEYVGVFRFGDGQCLIATKRSYDQGETFTAIAQQPEVQQPEVDEATTAEWRAFVDGDES